MLPVQSSPSNQPRSADFTSHRILVVDDQTDVRAGYRWLLEAYGFSVSEAADGTDALRFLRQHPVDLILTDLYMPDMDGLTLLRQLRDIPSAPPVIAMSGSGHLGREAALEAARVLGADAALRKPISGELLLSTILSILPPDGIAVN